MCLRRFRDIDRILRRCQIYGLLNRADILHFIVLLTTEYKTLHFIDALKSPEADNALRET